MIGSKPNWMAGAIDVARPADQHVEVAVVALVEFDMRLRRQHHVAPAVRAAIEGGGREGARGAERAP